MNKKSIFLVLVIMCFILGVYIFTKGIIETDFKYILIGLFDFIASGVNGYSYKNC